VNSTVSAHSVGAASKAPPYATLEGITQVIRIAVPSSAEPIIG